MRTSGDIDVLAKVAFDSAEHELVGLCALEDKDACMAVGRCSGPKFVWKPALGKPGTSSMRCSRITAAWEAVVTWLRCLIVYWDAEAGAARCHLPTVSKARWRLCFQDWTVLGSSVHAKAFRWWTSVLTLDILRYKPKVQLLLQSAVKIAKAARSFDERKATNNWLSWLKEGPAKGLGAQHRMSRNKWRRQPANASSRAGLRDYGGLVQVGGTRTVHLSA